MPRTPRIDYPGARHHVFNRGARHADVFVSDTVRRKFLFFLSRLPARHALVIHGYALMGNHFHLLVEVPRGNLSEAMRTLLGDFCMWLNFVHGWDGPVFRGRFGNRIVQSDGYWTHLLAYVHCNPVRAGLVDQPAEAPWTSCRVYEGLEESPPWLTTAQMLEMHGGVRALHEYTLAVADRTETGPSEFDPETLFDGGKTDWTPGVLIPSAKSVDVAVQEVCELTGLGPATLLRNGPRRSQPEKVVLAWWLSRAAEMSYQRQSQLMGVTPSAIGQRVRRAERELTKCPTGQEASWMRELISRG
mgnify:CR=1 FL=1